MNNTEPLEILKRNKKGLYVAIFLLIVGIGLIIWGTSLSNSKEKIIAKDYNELITNKNDTAEEYAKITISYLPYLFAKENVNYGTKKYYIVFDNNDYPYIVRLQDSTYNKLEKQYDNKEKISYEIKGYLYNQKNELKKLAIDGYKDLFEDSDISESNYELYFGKTYLDETARPLPFNKSISIIIGFILSIFSIIVIIFYIVTSIKFKKIFKEYTLEELESELVKPDTKYYKKQKICLTDKYIISTLSGISIIKYEDILWSYIENRSYNGVPIGKFIIARTNNKKRYQLASTLKDEDILIKILKDIREKNEKILIGFNKENDQKYRELTKK